MDPKTRETKGFFEEFRYFLVHKKKIWIAEMVFFLLLLGSLFYLLDDPVKLPPFIYIDF